MEYSQKKQIDENLPKLIENTWCTALLLATLQSQEVLSATDVELLNVKGTNEGRSVQVAKFYEIMKTKPPSSYNLLIDALDTTCQQGASIHLKTLPENENSNSTSKTPGLSASIIVGTSECEIGEIVNIVENDSVGHALDMSTFARKLIPSKSAQRRIILNSNASNGEKLEKILELWKGSVGSSATLAVLLQVLRDASAVSVAESIEKALNVL